MGSLNKDGHSGSSENDYIDPTPVLPGRSGEIENTALHISGIHIFPAKPNDLQTNDHTINDEKHH
jgi:hypothetical protein